MMSSANLELSRSASRKSLGLVGLLLLSSLSAVLIVPTASAVSGDYEITESLSPMPGQYLEPYEQLFIEVKITNTGFFNTQDDRGIEWWICEDTSSNCKADSEQYGSEQIQPIPVGQSIDFQFTNPFSPNSNFDGAYKIIYEFSESDTGNSSNDYLETIFYFTPALVDVSINVQDPTTQLNGLAVYNDVKILNTDTDYFMDISGVVNSCASCELDAGLGWKLYNSTGDEVGSSTLSVTDLPAWGQSSFTRSLPAFTHSEEGTYTMEFGLIESSGANYGDLNDYNNLQSVEVTFDDTVDIQIMQMYPLNAPTSPTYFYGNNSVGVVIKNLGNHTVTEPLVRFTVMDLTDEIESEEDCYPDEILPSHEYYCIFDLNALGDKNLKVMASEMLNEGQDVRPADNIITQTAEVVAGAISPEIVQSNYFGEYNTGDNITLTAKTSSVAAGPLTYSWMQSGIISLGDGQEIELPGSFLGLGDQTISVIVTDALGTIDSETIEITVFNSTNIDTEDWLTGTAVTRTHAEGVAEFDLPVPGFNYGSGNNKQALLIMSIDVVPTDGSSDAGMDWMEFDLNISKMLPDNIPRDSIEVNRLFGMDQINWDPLEGDNSYTLIDNDTIRVNLTTNMDLLLVGEIPTPNITAGQPEITLLPDGAMSLSWEPQGDLNNQYFGGWKIYRITGIANGPTYFPDPSNQTSIGLWDGLLQDSYADYVEANNGTWLDPVKLETGTCVSYALIPANRAGDPSPLNGYVTLEDGSPGLTCGDAIDPNKQVSGFTSSIVYNNDTACHAQFEDWNSCYELTMSWDWPSNEPEGDITWNMYRIEQRPDEFDLKYVQPIATNIENVPGEKGYFYQNGTDDDGIRPLRTYYYILTPVDHIGNELTFIDYPSENVERVNVPDEYWNYNSHRIPEPEPEPEPPMGVEWFGEVEDSMETKSFQTALVVMIVVVMLNFIGLPLVLKRRKRLKKKIGKQDSKKPAEFDPNEFDDFFN